MSVPFRAGQSFVSSPIEIGAGRVRGAGGFTAVAGGRFIGAAAGHGPDFSAGRTLIAVLGCTSREATNDQKQK